LQIEPCYNPARLVNPSTDCQEEKRLSVPKRSAKMQSQPSRAFLKIGDVAKMAGVSPSVIRSWENLGLTRPQRSRSKYRLYTPDDVKLLKRARYLRRVRGLNAPAIVQLLKREGGMRAASNGNVPIGKQLRRLRLRHGLLLSQVAESVGISVGFLSALERSHMSASVGTLRKLARFYKTNILDFFEPAEASSRVVSPAKRKTLEAGPGVRMELLAWGNTVMEPHLFRIAPKAGSGESYSHEGEEFLYVLRGELQISVEEEEYRLKTGDSFYFESSSPHRWFNPGHNESLILWVNTPPTF
jgi:DNA-binding transcriptional MerR regulator/quercetin dioxygenase-like cupin family protein